MRAGGGDPTAACQPERIILRNAYVNVSNYSVLNVKGSDFGLLI